MELQSEMTATLVDLILKTGSCELPSLQESAHIHRIFLSALRVQRNQNLDRKYSYVPIT